MVKHEPDCMSIVNPTFGEGQTPCTCGADLNPAPAPMPEEVEDAIKELCTLAAIEPGDGLAAVTCDIILSHITDLTRRLAEVEASLDRKTADQVIAVFLARAEAAEAKSARLGRKLQRVGLHLAETRKKLRKVEGERDALRERCDELEWLREVEAWRPPTTHHNDGNGSGKRWFNSCQEYSATLQAALATEVNP